jgi:hypothetical protein
VVWIDYVELLSSGAYYLVVESRSGAPEHQRQ